MKILVFTLDGQDSLFSDISNLLRKELFPDINVQQVSIEKNYHAHSDSEMHKRCKTYLKLLRASFLASGDFEIVVNNDSQTNWCYFGYTADFGDFCFELQHKQMACLFPAVAVADRIVMLPEAFNDGLDVHPRSFLWLPQPLEMEGVELVDFNVPEALEHAVRRVGIQLKQEWKALSHRQMGVRGLFTPDFEELAKLLKIDASFLHRNNLFSPDVRLTANITGRAIEGVASTVTLEVQNEGGRPLKNIRVRLRGPFRSLKSPVSKICDLVPPAAVRFGFEIIAKTAPFCPLEVFVDLGDEPLDIPSCPIPVLLDVIPGGIMPIETPIQPLTEGH